MAKPQSARRQKLNGYSYNPGRIKDKLGQLVENRVGRLLEEAFKRGEIAWFRHSPKQSRLDHRGIDFTIYPKSGDPIPPQVKSSKWMADQFTRDHPGVYVIVAPLMIEDAQVIAQLHRIINRPV